jgi:hypothetical protein
MPWLTPINPSDITNRAMAYLPATQLVQTDAFAPEYFPAPQSKHADAPSVARYVPAAHSKHADALDAPSVARYVPAAQARQAVAPDCAGRRMRIWLWQLSTWY